MQNNDIAILCRAALSLEREAHLLGKNIEVEIQRIIEKLKEQPK
jgi:hypothetical protein